MKLNWLTQKHFQFANFVTEDELLASQVIIDVTHHYIQTSVGTLKNPNYRDNEIEIYKCILEFLNKRLKFSRYTYSFDDLKQRAIFILLGEFELDAAECGYVTQSSPNEVLRIFNYAKFQFTQKKMIQKEMHHESWN